MSSTPVTADADAESTSIDWVSFYESINASPDTAQSPSQVATMLKIRHDDVADEDEAEEILDRARSAGELEKFNGGLIVAGHDEGPSNNDVGSVPQDESETKPAPEEMPRTELEGEVRDLRKRVDDLEDDLDLVFDQLFELQDIVTGEMGTTAAATVTEQNGGVMQRLDDLEAGGQSNDTVDRSNLLPAHQMWEQYSTTGGDGMGKSQRRTGALFGEFVRTVTTDEPTVVDASGQLFTLNTDAATRTLEDVGELDGVAEESKSTLVARVMRNVHGMTKTEECECDSTDACGHSMIDFRSGKPHVLAVPKQQFIAAMKNAYGVAEGVEDGEVTSADDSSEQDDEATGDDVDMDDLVNADTEGDR